MKLSGVGLEPHDCNDEFLIKRLGLYQGGIRVIVAIMILGVIGGLCYAVAESAFYILVPFFLPCILLGLLVFLIYREKKAIQEELENRYPKNTEKAAFIAEMAQKSKRKSVITIAGIIVISVIAVFWISGKFIGGHGGSSGTGSVTCPNCGAGYRSEHSAAGFIRENGYCSSCQGR